jgi:hypothetical protein
MGVEPALDLDKLSGPARKLIDPASPAAMRQMAAKGIAPGLRPGDALTVLVLLAESDDATLSATAQATLDKLPLPVLNGALSGDVPPGVLAAIAPRYAQNAAVMEKLLAHPAIPPHAVAAVAATANEAVAELVATNEEKLLANPAIIEKLY